MPNAKRLLARLLCAVVIWRDVVDIKGFRCQIAAPARLRFAALEIFAQRQLQSALSLILPPIPPCAFARIFGNGTGLLLGFAIVILHRPPVALRGTVGRIPTATCLPKISAFAGPAASGGKGNRIGPQLVHLRERGGMLMGCF
jgi:hypothetical protein